MILSRLFVLCLIAAHICIVCPLSMVGSGTAKGETKRLATISGRVTNEKGSPLPAAVVVVRPSRQWPRPIRKGSWPADTSIATTNAAGDFRLELEIDAGDSIRELDILAYSPEHRLGVGSSRPIELGYSRFKIEVGHTKEVAIVLEPAAYFAGHVVDDDGHPIPEVLVRASVTVDRDACITDERGFFELFELPLAPVEVHGLRGHPAAQRATLLATHPMYSEQLLVDIYDIAAEERNRMRVSLSKGVQVRGRVLGPTGEPVQDVFVHIIQGALVWGKSVRTDAQGYFMVGGLHKDKVSVTCIDHGNRLSGKKVFAEPFDLSEDPLQLSVIPAFTGVSVPSLGVELADMTHDIDRAFLLNRAEGVIVLNIHDPKRATVLRMGDCIVGCNFRAIRCMSDFGAALEGIGSRPSVEGRTGQLEVIVTRWMDGRLVTSTDHMPITKDLLSDLRSLARHEQ